MNFLGLVSFKLFGFAAFQTAFLVTATFVVRCEQLVMKRQANACVVRTSEEELAMSVMRTFSTFLAARNAAAIPGALQQSCPEFVLLLPRWVLDI